MVEVQWWEAGLLALIPVGAGLVAGIVTAILTHRLTTSATQRAEERETERRKSAEERDAVRQLRRERMQPVLDFIALAGQYAAGDVIRGTLRHVQDNLDNSTRVEKMAHEVLQAVPDEMKLGHACAMAAMSSTGVPNLGPLLMTAINDVLGEDKAGLTSTMRTLEETVERFLVDV